MSAIPMSTSSEADVIIPAVWTLKADEHFKEFPEDKATMLRCYADPKEFLKFWYIQAEGQEKLLLGADLWEAQEIFLTEAALHKWIFFLKARQLGESTIECAYDGWRTRFGPSNARTHIMSRAAEESESLLRDVKYGLDNLPWWMKLDYERERDKEIKFYAGPGDTRTIHAYPSKSPGRGETCTHAHVDEWADMENPSKVWSAVEPSVVPGGQYEDRGGGEDEETTAARNKELARVAAAVMASVAPGGTCHILTTGAGPESYTSTYYRKCRARDGKHRACFINALTRPGHDMEWYRREKASAADITLFTREHPLTWEEALAGAGDLYFEAKALDATGVDARPLTAQGQWFCPQKRNARWRSDKAGKCPECGSGLRRCLYVIAWDIGRHKDCAVGVVEDVTGPVHFVAGYYRLREQTYPTIQTYIEQNVIDFPGAYIVVEKNNAGEAVVENLNLPEGRVEMHNTSQASKARALATLRASTQAQTIKFSHEECDQLTAEMRGYQLPDAGIVQDSVMALSIAEEHAGQAIQAQGTSLGPFHV